MEGTFSFTTVPSQPKDTKVYKREIASNLKSPKARKVLRQLTSGKLIEKQAVL